MITIRFKRKSHVNSRKEVPEIKIQTTRAPFYIFTNKGRKKNIIPFHSDLRKFLLTFNIFRENCPRSYFICDNKCKC